MNEFEKRINALRIQFKEERIQIVKDCNLTVGRLNTAIGMVNSQEAREALRAEKLRVREARDRSLKCNRICYHEQLELLNEEYMLSLNKAPSKRQLRRMMAHIRDYADSIGEKSLKFYFDNDRFCEITFN